MPFIEALGITAGLMTTFAFLPQALKVGRGGSAKDLSYLMLSFQACGNLLWLLYGLFIQSIPVSGANAITFVMVFTILIFKRFPPPRLGNAELR